MSGTPEPGKLVDDNERQRDAIHIALAPVRAAERLLPGQHVGLVDPDDPNLVAPAETNIGIVDPFLTDVIEAGQRFWLFLHSDDEEDPWESSISYATLLEFGRSAVEEDNFFFSCGSNMTMCDELRSNCEDFWKNWSIITGIPVPAKALLETSFSCAC